MEVFNEDASVAFRHLQRRKRGREMKRTTIYLEDQMHDDLMELARRENSDMAKQIRAAITERLKKKLKKERPA